MKKKSKKEYMKKRRRLLAFPILFFFIAVAIHIHNSHVESVQASKSIALSSNVGSNTANKPEESPQKKEAPSCKDELTGSQGDQAIENLSTKIKNYLGSDVDKVGFVYYDLSSNKSIALNEDKVCIAASTYKVSMNLVAYNMINDGKFNLTDTVPYKADFYETGAGSLQYKTKTLSKSPIAFSTLLDLSITQSDNIATNMISDKIGGADYVRKEVSNITGVTDIDTTTNVITPKIAFRLLKTLYDNKSNENYAHLINAMKETEFHDRIDKYLPHKLVAHKIGNFDSYTNDIGIVFTDKPYIFVIYVDGLPKPEEKIAKISKMVYDAQLTK